MADPNSIPEVRQCPKCGTSDRYARGSCKECGKRRSSAYRETHTDEAKASNAIWRKANHEKAKASSTSWYRNNYEKSRARNTLWAKNNPEKMKAFKDAWAKENPEKIKHKNTAWAKANPIKIRAYGVSYRKSSLEKIKAARIVWRYKNLEKAKASIAVWRKENIEKIKAYDTLYRKLNPEVGKRKTHNRRSRKLESGGVLSTGISAKLFALQKGKCACCGVSIADGYHMDHVMPLALGGKNEDWNIQLLAPRCNLHKSAKDPIDYMQSKGFLL